MPGTNLRRVAYSAAILPQACAVTSRCLSHPRVAACTFYGGLTILLLLKITVPTGVWLYCNFFSMPGKRSYVSALPGSLTQEQLRRQARDRAFLPQPPPPPLSQVPRRTSAWEDIPVGKDANDSVVTMCERATQCDPSYIAEQAEPPLSGYYLDTISRAVRIIELQCRLPDVPLPSRTISLNALLPSPECAAPPLVPEGATAAYIAALETKQLFFKPKSARMKSELLNWKILFPALVPLLAQTGLITML